MRVSRLICRYSEPGFGWIRVLGRGIAWKDTRRHRMLFSERMGHCLRIGSWLIRWLPAKLGRP